MTTLVIGGDSYEAKRNCSCLHALKVDKLYLARDGEGELTTGLDGMSPPAVTSVGGVNLPCSSTAIAGTDSTCFESKVVESDRCRGVSDTARVVQVVTHRRHTVSSGVQKGMRLDRKGVTGY